MSLTSRKGLAFSKAGREPRTNKLELIHTGVWRPSTITSLRCSNYYVTFIDDSSRKVWVYFLKLKSGDFKTWKVMVENETDLKIQTLQLDNTGKYVNAEFQRYCDENSIKMRRTVPRNP